MNYFNIIFILGLINVFYAGMNGGITLLRKREGVKFELTHYLTIIFPASLGIYLLMTVYHDLSLNCVSIDYN